MWLQSPLSCTPLQAWVLALESGLGFLCPWIDSCDEISYSLCKVPWDGKNRLLVWDEILMLIVVFLLKTISTKLIHSKFMTVNTSIYMAILLYFLNSKMILLVPMNFGGASPPTPAWRKCSVVTLPHKSTLTFLLNHPSQIIAFLWICLHYINLFRKPWNQKIPIREVLCM